MEEVWSKIKNGFINNIFIIIVGIACLAYICYGIIDISETGKSLTQILMDGAIAFLFATFIIKMFDIDALKRGNKIEKVLQKQNEHERIANEVAEHCDLLEKWCMQKNKQAYISARTRILEAVGIKYSDYERKLLDYDKLTKQQKQAIKKADKVKITKLNTNYLLGETAKTNDPHNIGRSKVDYERNIGFTSMFSRIATMIIAGYYSVDVITSASLMDLAWAFVQVVFFLLMGGLRWGQTYMYMNDEYPSFINGKINFLKEFQTAVENHELDDVEIQTQKVIIKNLYKREKANGELAEPRGFGEKENEQENFAVEHTDADIKTASTDGEQCIAESNGTASTVSGEQHSNECGITGQQCSADTISEQYPTASNANGATTEHESIAGTEPSTSDFEQSVANTEPNANDN